MLIKADIASLLVRPIAGSPGTDGDALSADIIVDPPAEDERIAVLQQENDSLRAALAEALESARADEARAREEGKKAGSEAAQRDDEKRIETLGSGVEQALDRWEERLDALDALVPLVARAALAKLFDEHADQADLVARAIARQLGRLRRESLVAIHVSAADFPDEAAVAALRARAGTGEARLVVDSNLGAGECRIVLGLGQMDVGPKTQWAALSALLAEPDQGAER